jgi:hypothetical protein
LLRLQQAARLGHSLDEYTFEKHWNDWYERNLRNGTWAKDRARWHKMYFNRYFKDYFSNSDSSSMLLNDITPQFAAGYWDWRKSYWSTENAAKLQSYNPKRRGAKTRGTANAKKAPALKTLLMEQSALNQIFYDAFERGWRAPIGWSGLKVSASWASGLSGRCFPALVGDIPMRCAA